MIYDQLNSLEIKKKKNPIGSASPLVIPTQHI